LFSGLSTSMLGDSVMLLVLSMWVKTLTDSNAMAGLTFFFMVLPALGAPLLGVWVDRLPRKPILVWGNLASAAAVLPLVRVRDEHDVWFASMSRSSGSTIQGVGAIAGGLTASLVVRRIGEVAGTVAGLATMAFSTAVVALAPTLTVVFVGVVFLGIAIPWTFVAFTTLMQRRSPGHLIGRVSATVDVLLSAPQAISLAVGSLLVSLLDYRTIFWIIAVVMTFGALQIAATLRDQIRADVRNGGTPQQPVPAAEADLTTGADLL
jgi:predicted MFS family arabinose efflux permease